MCLTCAFDLSDFSSISKYMETIWLRMILFSFLCWKIQSEKKVCECSSAGKLKSSTQGFSLPLETCLIKTMLQLISWAWLYLRIGSWCGIKYLAPYGEHFYGHCFVISKLLKWPLLMYFLPWLVTLDLGDALYKKCLAKHPRCFVISGSDSPLSSLSVCL